MTKRPFDPPNYDQIHQLSLSVIASSEYYDKCVDQYARGEVSSDVLADALEQFQDDSADLSIASRKLEEKTLVIGTNKNEIYALTIDHYFVTVRVCKALNISGGLDEMAIKQTIDVV